MYGNGQNSKSLISQLETSIKNEDNFFNMSGGEQLRDYSKVEDIAKKVINIYKTKKNRYGRPHACELLPACGSASCSHARTRQAVLLI